MTGFLLSATLEEMIKKIGENCRVLLDENLPVECGQYLQASLQASGTTIQKSKYFRGCETEAIIYIGPGSLEAFSRPKLRLGIITCYYKLTTPTQEDNEELFDTYLGYVMAEGPNPNDELKYDGDDFNACIGRQFLLK